MWKKSQLWSPIVPWLHLNATRKREKAATTHPYRGVAVAFSLLLLSLFPQVNADGDKRVA
jgi:hypothetical protein